MGRLWTTIRAHRQSARRFAFFWGLVALVEAVIFAGFAPGSTVRNTGEFATLAFSIILPFLVGAVAASWETKAPAALAGSLVSIVNTAWLVAVDRLGELVHPSAPGPTDEPVTWVSILMQFVVFVILALVVGGILAYLGGLITRRRRRDRVTSDRRASTRL